MSLDSEALAKKCEVRAKDLSTSLRRDVLVTVEDVVRLLLDLAKDIRLSHF